MKKTIWKFELNFIGKNIIEMPLNAEILTIQTQNQIPCLWALVDPTETKNNRIFEVYGTGFVINTEGKYLGTCQLYQGGLVWHVFENTSQL